MLQAELLHQRLDPVAGEDAHQVVVEAEEELRRPRVALPSAAPAQLVVDPPGLVPFRADDAQPTLLEDLGLFLLAHLLDGQPGEPFVFGAGLDALHFHFGPEQALDTAAEHDVGAAAGHVRGDGNRTLAPGLGDDVRLALVVFRVQRLVRNPRFLEALGHDLRLFDRSRADEDRSAAFAVLLHLGDDRVVLVLVVQVDLVLGVVADHRPVRRDGEHVEVVDLRELGRLGHRRAGHARELVEHAEVVLQGDRRQDLGLFLGLEPLFGFHRLV